MNNPSSIGQRAQCIHRFTKGPRMGQQCTTLVNRNNEPSTPLCAKHKRPTCTICLDTVLQGTGVVTRCKHVFHTTCLEQINNNSCPNCRAPLVPGMVVPTDAPTTLLSRPTGVVMIVAHFSDTESGSSSSDDNQDDQDDDDDDDDDPANRIDVNQNTTTPTRIPHEIFHEDIALIMHAVGGRERLIDILLEYF